MGDLSYTQFVTLQAIGIFSSSLSILGSSLIIVSIFRQQEQQKNIKKNTLHQLLLGLSVSDILCALVIMTLSLTNSKESSDSISWAVGNKYTCSASGFLYILTAASANFYNMFMSVHFYRIVTTGKKRAISSQSTKQKDWWFRLVAHSVSIFIPILISVAGVITNAYNDAKFFGVCLYGDEARLIRYSRNALTCIIALISIVFTLMLTSHIWYQINRSRQYSISQQLPKTLNTLPVQSCKADATFAKTQTPKARKQREVATQAIYYMLAYLNSFLFVVLVSIVLNITDARESPGNPGPYAMLVLVWFFQPIQGALNFIVFIRPRYRGWKVYFLKQQHRDADNNPTMPSFLFILKKAILEQVPFSRQPRPGLKALHDQSDQDRISPVQVRLQSMPLEARLSSTAGSSFSHGLPLSIPEDLSISTSKIDENTGKDGRYIFGLSTDHDESYSC